MLSAVDVLALAEKTDVQHSSSRIKFSVHTTGCLRSFYPLKDCLWYLLVANFCLTSIQFLVITSTVFNKDSSRATTLGYLNSFNNDISKIN